MLSGGNKNSNVQMRGGNKFEEEIDIEDILNTVNYIYLEEHSKLESYESSKSKSS